MSKRKSIVWVCPGFAANEANTQCIPPLQLLAKELGQNKSIDLRIISLHYPEKEQPYIWNGIKVYPCFQKSIFSKSRTRWNVFQTIQQLHQEQAIDALHSFWLSDAAFIAHWKSRFLKIPHWVTLGGQDARPSNRYLNILPLRKMNIFAVSQFHAEVWKATTGLDVQAILPWGIPSDPLDVVLEKERTIDILGVGNLVKLKDYSLFLELVKQLVIERPELSAVIIGTGEERNMLEQKINEYNLSKHIRLTGDVPRQEVEKYMEQSKVLFHPSSYESFGFVFVEALKNGLNIVSRSVGIAAPSSNWWVGNTPSELLDSLKQALDNFEEPRRSFPYPISETVKQYLEIYNS